MKNFPLTAVKGFFLSLVILFANQQASTQSDTISGQVLHDAETLVRDFFLAGNCIDVFNFQLTGRQGQAGTFQDGMASIGLEAGIVLTTGHIDSITGPNTHWDSSGDYGANISTDPDLETLDTIFTGGAQARTFSDMVILEFDFTPTVNEASFDFVFASEEYCFYSFTSFIDIFGFFVSGPGLNGPYQNNGVNIALVPGTQTPITAFTINSFINPEYYSSNTIPVELDNGCVISPAVAPDLIEFDGFTKPLSARFNVIPCETYHVKLAITDTSDGGFDSAVFLKAQSFAAGRTSAISGNITGQSANGNTPYEGCGSAEIIFSRADDVTTSDLVIQYDILPASTATPGVDFTALPDSIVIPAGVLTDTVFLDFFQDGINEGGEFFTIKLRNPCSCAESELTISIADPVPLSAQIEGVQKVCNGDELILTAIPSGGFGTISYEWPNGDTDPVYDVLPITGQTHQLIVSDECFQTDTIDHFVDVLYPTALIDGQGVICDGLPDFSYAVALGGADTFSFGILQGVDITLYEDITVDTLWIPATESGIFQLVNVFGEGCPADGQGFAQALVVDISTNVFIDSIDCFGANNAYAAIVPGDGDGLYSYMWSHDNLLTQDTAFNLGIGDYEVYINDSQGCLDTARFSITQPSELLLEIDTLQLIANCSIDGGLLAMGSGGTEPLSYIWSDGTIDALNDNLPPALYTVTLTDANNCIQERSVEIINDGDLPIIEVFVSDTLDCLTSMVTITTGNSSQGDNIVYVWTNAAGEELVLADPRNWDTDIPGVYTLEINDTISSCSNITSIEVVIDTLTPSAIIVSDFPAINCYQPVINLSAQDVSQNWVATWTDLDADTLLATAQWNVDVFSGGEYELFVTNVENGCTNRDTFTLNSQFDFPTATIPTPDSLNCEASEVDLTIVATAGSGFYSFNWSGPGISGPTDEMIVTVTMEGEYELILLDVISGCSDTLATQVVIDTASLLLYPISDTTLTCLVTEIDLTASSPASGTLQYAWEDENGTELSNTTDITINTIGDYTLNVIDTDNNCTQSLTVTIDEDLERPIIMITPPDSLDCMTNSIVLSALSSNDQTPTWLDENGNVLLDNSWTYNASEAGFYQLMVTNNGNGCVDTQQVELMIDTIPPLADIVVPGQLSCEDDGITLSTNNTTGSGDYTYDWSGPTGGINGANDGATVLVDNPGQYTLLLTDNKNGCSAEIMASVLEDGDFPVIDTIADTLINCYNPAISLEASSPTIANLDYQWLDENEMILSQTPILNITQAGIYEIEITNIDNNCTSSYSVTIGADFEKPSVDAGDDIQIDCANEIATLTAVEGETTWTPSWLDADGLVLSTGEWTITTNEVGTYQLVVLDTENGCDNEDIALVTENQNMPIANAGNDVFIDCFNNTATIDISGSSSGTTILYQLFDGAGNLIDEGNNTSISVEQADSYLLIVTDTASQCVSQDDVIVSMDMPQIASVSSINAFCFGEEGSLIVDNVIGGIAPYLYSINDGQSYQANPVFSGLQAGSYQIMVQDVNGCIGETMAILQAPQEMVIYLPELDVLAVGDSIILEAILVNTDTAQLASFSWSNSDQLSCLKCLSPLFKARETELLEFTIVDKNGCIASVQILIVVDQRIPVYVPNVFTPHNEDGNNDLLVVYGNQDQIVEITSFSIFNRWGGLVFNQKNFPINAPLFGWDGRLNGAPLNSGVFVYSLEVLLITGETVQLAGDIVLLE